GGGGEEPGGCAGGEFEEGDPETIGGELSEPLQAARKQNSAQTATRTPILNSCFQDFPSVFFSHTSLLKTPLLVRTLGSTDRSPWSVVGLSTHAVRSAFTTSKMYRAVNSNVGSAALTVQTLRENEKSGYGDQHSSHMSLRRRGGGYLMTAL